MKPLLWKSTKRMVSSSSEVAERRIVLNACSGSVTGNSSSSSGCPSWSKFPEYHEPRNSIFFISWKAMRAMTGDGHMQRAERPNAMDRG